MRKDKSNLEEFYDKINSIADIYLSRTIKTIGKFFKNLFKL